MANLAELLGKRLKELRKQRGLKQEDMEKFGLNYKYYQRIENGKVNLTLATVEKIALAFEIEPEEIFSMPLSASPEGNKLASQIEAIIKSNDREAIRKILVVINEVI